MVTKGVKSEKCILSNSAEFALAAVTLCCISSSPHSCGNGYIKTWEMRPKNPLRLITWSNILSVGQQLHCASFIPPASLWCTVWNEWLIRRKQSQWDQLLSDPLMSATRRDLILLLFGFMRKRDKKKNHVCKLESKVWMVRDRDRIYQGDGAACNFIGDNEHLKWQFMRGPHLLVILEVHLLCSRAA